MEYRPLGRTGVQVSSVCLGAWQFGGRATPEESETIIHTALDRGVNFIDTSNVYGGGVGDSEEILGRVVGSQEIRDRLILATKVFFPADPEDPNGRGVSRRHIIQQCENSLRRLQTDYIDLYYLHRLDPRFPIDESLRALDDLIRAGKVRYVGTSTAAAWQMVESLWVSKELGLNRFIAETPPYNILDRRIEREFVPMAQTFGIAINPWAPLAGSLLTGIYTRGQAPPPDSRLADEQFATTTARRMNERVHDVGDVIAKIAQNYEKSSAAVAFAWVMSQPGITSPILGPEKLSDLTDSLTALDISLTDEDLASIDEVAPPGGMISSFYDSNTEGVIGVNQFMAHPYRVF